jgi:hypothetical protein
MGKMLSSQFIIPSDSLSHKIFLLYKKASIVHWKHSILNDIQSCDKDPHKDHILYHKIELSSVSAAASKLESVFNFKTISVGDYQSVHLSCFSLSADPSSLSAKLCDLYCAHRTRLLSCLIRHLLRSASVTACNPPLTFI